MNVRLHRKQALLIGLAVVLAIASYWIPAPQTPFEEATKEISRPPVGVGSAESITTAREPGLLERFSIAVQLEQAPKVAPTVEDGPLLFSWVGRKENTAMPAPTRRFFAPKEITHKDAVRSDPSFMLPIRNFSLPDSH
jgi:hypothetical protein